MAAFGGSLFNLKPEAAGTANWRLLRGATALKLAGALNPLGAGCDFAVEELKAAGLLAGDNEETESDSLTFGRGVD